MEKIIFSDTMYDKVVDDVFGIVECKDFATFQHTIEDIDDNGTYMELIATLVVYRSKIVAYPDTGLEGGDITDVIPIWWECNTFDENGNEIENDFSFDTIRERLVKYRW